MPNSSPLAAGVVAVIAHRGASRAARENTLEAFAKARALRADAVELDVRRTADGALVVHHDPVVEGLGPIIDFTEAEIRAGAPWVPGLADALDACAGMWVNVEVKNLPPEPDWDPDDHAAAAVVEILSRRAAGPPVVVSSFNPATLGAVRALDSSLPTALLSIGVVDPLTALAAAADAGHVAVHPEVGGLAGDVLTRAVERGREVGVAVVPWTVDDPAEISRLAAAGVAGVITNVPDVARVAVDDAVSRTAPPG